MATNSYIVRAKQKGYEGVFCRFDGHPRHQGPILLENYNTPRKVAQLLKRGPILSLEPFVGKKHNIFDEPKGMTTYFGRDGGTTPAVPRYAPSMENVLQWLVGIGVEYLYVFDGIWIFARRIPYCSGQTEELWSDFEPLMSYFSPTAEECAFFLENE